LVVTLHAVESGIEKVLPIQDFHISNYIDPQEYVLAGIVWIQENIGGVFTRVVDYSLGAFILIFGIFVFLRDGNKFVEKMVTLSPLTENFDRQIAHKIQVAFNSVIVGEVVIAIVQGLLAGAGFWFFGIPNAAIWGVIAAIAALVPVVGTGFVFFPVILFSFLVLGWVPALGLFAWWVLVVSIVDNIMRPVIIERGIHINPLLILISVLGGLHAFGPIGFVAGPLILAFFFALLDIYPLLVERLADDK
jgi:predicted PurR-regulated permease PerM